jgi:hypothetical protein
MNTTENETYLTSTNEATGEKITLLSIKKHGKRIYSVDFFGPYNDYRNEYTGNNKNKAFFIFDTFVKECLFS